MVAARHQDPQELETLNRSTKGIVLSIDGPKPEKGYETLYVVRKVTQNRVWFFPEEELVGFATFTATASRLASQQQHGVIQKARSKKRILILNQLEARILNPSD